MKFNPSSELKKYEVMADAAKRIGLRDSSSLSRLAKRGSIRSISFGSKLVYLHKDDVDKYHSELPKRREAARALKEGKASLIQKNFSRWEEVVPLANKKEEKNEISFFWDDPKFQQAITQLVERAVESKIKQIL